MSAPESASPIPNGSGFFWDHDAVRVVVRWASGHRDLLATVGTASAVAFVLTVASIPILVTRLPADYFTSSRAPRRSHPLVALVRNVLSFALFVVGLALLVLPGQGLLTILLSVVLSTIPAKRRLLRMLTRRPRVQRSLNWMRRRRGAEPFSFPDPSE